MTQGQLRTQIANGLHWVRDEIDKSLERVRIQIEQRVEHPEDPMPLQKALAEVHALRGIAVLIQCNAVAILAEEMTQVVSALMLERVKDAESACGALLGAVMQVSDYVSSLVMGEEDCALVLQPQINELRLARNKPILTEPELFALHLHSLGLVLPWSAPAHPGAQEEARKLLPHFQKSLLSWLKKEPDARLSLGRIGKIAEQIAERSEDAQLHQLWRIVAATAEALLADELDHLTEIKRLIGAAGQQIKLLGDQGETAALEKLGDLSGLLLFHIGRSDAQGVRVLALRKTFTFEAILPPAKVLDERRTRLRGPGVVLLHHVADEVRKDINRVKDGIDLIVRSGKMQPEDTASISTHLHRIASTLSVLGLASMQQVLENQRKSLETLPQNKDVSAAWMSLATAILRVELELEDALFHQAQQAGATLPTPQAPGQPHRRDLADSVAALLRETLVNLARVKTCADYYIKGEDAAAQVTESVRLLTQISAAFRILQKDRVAELIGHLSRYIHSGHFEQVRDNPERAERFADVVASIEYYIEAVRDQLPEADPILDRLAGYVSQLELEQADVAAPLMAAPSAPAPAPTMTQADSIDPEIRDIFVSEAEEVLQTLQDSLPALRRNGQDREALSTVRRAFHTLKGSGRMVGAVQIGEFGWAVERLLNRCIENELTVDARTLDVVDEAVGLLPRLIERFRDGHLFEEPELNAVIDSADQLTSGAKQEPAAPTPVDAAADAEIISVFQEDSAEKLDTIDRWVDAQNPRSSTFGVDGDVLRMFHTLGGSAHVANLPEVAELAMAMETFLMVARDADARLSTDALRLIADVSATLRQWVAAAGTAKTQVQDAQPWLQRIEQTQGGLSQAVREKAEDRHLVEIFSSEALELLQRMESELNAWMHAPEFRQAAADVRDLSHTLVGAALMSNCSAIANPARALNRLMTRRVSAPSPAPSFFVEMRHFFEELYLILDGYHLGHHRNDGTALAARITAFDDALLSVPAPRVTSATTVARTTPVTAPYGEHDPELTEIFISEAEELLQSLDSSGAAWEVDPTNAAVGGEVRRLLHTLKGSARVAGFAGIGDYAAWMEQRVLSLGATRPSRELLAQLSQANDGLHRLIDDLKNGRPLQVARLLQDLEAPPAVVEPAAAPEPELEVTLEAAPEPELEADEIIEIPPVFEDTPLEPILATPIERSSETLSPPVEPGPVASADVELVGIFSAEAAELLESLDQSLGAWRREPRDLMGAREMQRALHTLKGGARMAGLNAMGNSAHDLETTIDAMLASERIDPTALEDLSAPLEALQHMHDLMERGDYAPLQVERYVPVSGSVSAPTPVAPDLVVDEPEFEEERVALVVVAAPQISSLWDTQLFWRPDEEGPGLLASRRETARVPVEHLDSMLNQAGEISIYRSRLEEHNNGIQLQLNEMTQAIARVREQLRLMDIETEAQIAARGVGHATQQDRYAGDFDPLEMDRYTRMQELSRALSESVGDLSALHGTMDDLASEAETLLLQQGRINTEVQQGLMGTLMVPFSRQVARLQRVVKQTAQENNKQAEVQFIGIESELDRNVLERMTAPLEHLLRNAVIHGIEAPEQRAHADKLPQGTIQVSLRREGTQLLIELRDDGRGLDYAAIRANAIKRGLMAADAQITDEETAQFIFEPGFSTAQKLTHDAGRGIGMDVVASEVKQLGGTLELAAEPGKGTRFLIRLPLNLAISQALLVDVGHDLFAVPLVSIEGIVRIPREQLDELYKEDGGTLDYGGHDYRVSHLGDLIGIARPAEVEAKSVSAILVRLGEGLGTQDRRVAVVVDALHGNREIVSKAVGPLVSSVTGISGATILADGRVVLIVDIPALALERGRRVALAGGRQASASTDAADNNLIMVVDDSVTIRRVTERLLIKQGYRVVTAKDGLDAMARLQTEHPAAVLLDIEMPRADGFEVAAFIRNHERIHQLPIIMITSRSGDKHRERAKQIGVNRYLIKPFQEEDLLDNLRNVIEEARG